MKEELVSGITRLSTGNLFLADICNVGEEVAERLKNNTAKIQQQEQAAYEKARDTYLVLFSKSNNVLRSKPDWTSWNGKELLAVLNTMKRKSDGPLPKKKAELSSLYEEWNGSRTPFTFLEYCTMNNKKIPEGRPSELDLYSFEDDSDSDDENVENEVAAALLEFSAQSQSK